MKSIHSSGTLALLVLSLPQPALAQEAASATINTGDTSWMIVSTALVMLMTPGLAFFYGGMVRVKNAVSLVFQSFVALGIISVMWFVIGYSLAFSSGSPFIGGAEWAMFNGVGTSPNADYSATISHMLFATYQCKFAVITPALITGATAERMKFKSYCIFLLLWSLLIYVPVAHWVWAVGGYLRDLGALDFAGGTVVHMTAGFSALAAVLVLGKRHDFGKEDYAPWNVPKIALGTALLWFGWFGFNAGSALSAGELAVNALVGTHFATASAALTWMILDWVIKGKPSLTGFCIGSVVGLVAITPACGFVTPASGLVIGIIAATISNLAAMMRARTQLDESLDVFACHGLGGLSGMLLTGAFATKAVNAAGADGGAVLLASQLKAAGIVIVYSFVVTYILLKVLDLLVGLRPTTEEELQGLDLADHGEAAYIA